MYGVSSSGPSIFRISSKDAVDQIMDTYDIDKDGTLSIDEGAAVPIMSKENFPEADTYGDKKLTPEEFVSYIDEMKLQVSRGHTTTPFTDFLGGATININTFADIDAEAKNQSGKQSFMNYMFHLTEKYETAQKALANGEEVEAKKSGISQSLSKLV